MLIGNLGITPGNMLAPLAGYTDALFRDLVAERGGCGLICSEMVSVQGLLRGTDRTLGFLKRGTADLPFSVQLYGSDPVAVAIGAELACDEGADIIDINMGCPVRKVVRSGSGAALMRDPSLAARIVESTVRKVSVPVTAKLRSGWSFREINIVEVSKMLEDAGASALTVHPRPRSDGFSGSADWDIIGNVAESVEIPVIGNGDISEPEDALEMKRTTRCAGVMVGRAAVRNPWIFSQIEELKRNGACTPVTATDIEGLILKHFGALKDIHGPEKACILIRSYAGYYTRGIEGGRFLRGKLNTVCEAGEFIRTVKDFFDAERDICIH